MRCAVGVASASAFAAGLLLAACTDTYLYDERREREIPVDRSVSIQGDFCTPGSDQVVRPLKLLVAMDASQSMGVTDPDGTRARAVADLLDALPQEREVSLLVMLFAGSTTAFLSKSGLQEFEPITSFDQGDRDLLRQRILNFAAPGNMSNRDSTDFVKPLSDIYAVINRDLANARLMRRGDETRARYSVIFLSDGQPTNNQDDELLCGDAVRRIRQLKDLADDVKLNTVHVFLPTQPVSSTACDLDGGVIPPPPAGSQCEIPNLPPGACPLLIVNQNAERLSRMADLGGGNFRDFRNGEPINFLDFRFGQVRRTWVFDKVVVSNFSAPAGSPVELADTDGDGLLDDDERRARTLPWVVDTDGDGFSDGVEVYFNRRGGTFDPVGRLRDGGGGDQGCPPALRGVDGDCDGLLDCDEQLIGTNARRVDSDDDGVPDSVEFKLGTQPASSDLDEDPDNDGLTNGVELQLHTDPRAVDAKKLSLNGYRTQVTRRGGTDEFGRQCWDLRVDNVLLANTLADSRDAGVGDGGLPEARRGAGYNELFVSVSMRPGDDPTGRPLLRTFRHTTTRFPVGGIRSPPDGIVRLSNDDLVSGCPGAAGGVPTP
ncbi:MAG: VWA domain-containing protein [Myxococcaceae bacterium]|nr:VWA domain-containing protein [Myxococcaceae bacterium]